MLMFLRVRLLFFFLALEIATAKQSPSELLRDYHLKAIAARIEAMPKHTTALVSWVSDNDSSIPVMHLKMLALHKALEITEDAAEDPTDPNMAVPTPVAGGHFILRVLREVTRCLLEVFGGYCIVFWLSEVPMIITEINKAGREMQGGNSIWDVICLPLVAFAYCASLCCLVLPPAIVAAFTSIIVSGNSSASVLRTTLDVSGFIAGSFLITFLGILRAEGQESLVIGLVLVGLLLFSVVDFFCRIVLGSVQSELCFAMLE